MKFSLLGWLSRKPKAARPEPASELTREAYETFSNLLGSTGMDKWWKDVSEISFAHQEMLANAWIYILDFAERTNTMDQLKAFQKEEDGFVGGTCGAGEMSTFTRAELCYEVLYPQGHRKS